MYEKLYHELLLQYHRLVNTNTQLAEEIVRLRQKLGSTGEPDENIENRTSETSVNKYSSSTEKIALFRSLFKGRDDVFARRWQSTTSGKSGYQPVCENEWAEGLCDKNIYKCANCPNRRLKPLSGKET